MRRVLVASLALSLVGLSLVGCGRFGAEQREPWRTEAEQACLSQKRVQPSAYMSLAPEIDGPGVCGISRPFKITAFAGGTVGLSSRVTLGCPIIPQIDAWLVDIVQPAAEMYFGTAVAEVRAGSYSCRSRNNQRGAKYSEHAFGNAVDVHSFRLVDGREVTIKKGWNGASDTHDFLREVFVGACRHFTTVLGPGSDAFHYDHFHLDLARHDARGQRRICKPIIKFEPRIGPDVASRPTPRPRPVIRPAAPPEPESEPETEPTEIEEGDDPFAVSSAPSAAMRRPTLAAATPAPAPVYSAPRPAPVDTLPPGFERRPPIAVSGRLPAIDTRPSFPAERGPAPLGASPQSLGSVPPRQAGHSPALRSPIPPGASPAARGSASYAPAPVRSGPAPARSAPAGPPLVLQPRLLSGQGVY
jgi:hypothetical protein